MSETFKPLIKLTKKQMSYVVDDFHHACLTAINMVPSHDTRYSCLDYTFEEITHIMVNNSTPLLYNVREAVFSIIL